MRWCSGATAGEASPDVADTPGRGPRIARALQQAVEAHRKGDLSAAEAGYAAILAEFPEEFGALHMLGVIRNQQGLHEEAVELIGAALRQDGRSADAHYNLGISLAARHAPSRCRRLRAVGSPVLARRGLRSHCRRNSVSGLFSLC